MQGEAGQEARALHLLKRLSRELTALDLGTRVDEVQGTIGTAAFLREYVGPSKPLVIRGGVSHWRALRLWDREHLAAAAGAARVSVDVTPNGRGDAVTQIVGPGGERQLCFCTPHQRTTTFGEFLDFFFASRHPSPGGPVEVPYLQHQNSNLTEELPQLLGDVEAELPWAAEAFGTAPDAINLWIGDGRAATTFHKDAYENIYCVVAGTKIFYLLPPCDAYRLGLVSLPVASFEPVGEGGALLPVLGGGQRRVTWSPVDPSPQDRAAAAREHPLFFDPSLPAPLVAEVGPGDVLYLPSLWYHYVEQREGEGPDGWVVAVNAWYDMHWGSGYAHFKLTESLAADAGLVPRPPSPGASSNGGSEGGSGGSGGSGD